MFHWSESNGGKMDIMDDDVCSLDRQLVEHNRKHCEVLSSKCPFCALRRIADSLELIAMIVHKQMVESSQLGVVQ